MLSAILVFLDPDPGSRSGSEWEQDQEKRGLISLSERSRTPEKELMGSVTSSKSCWKSLEVTQPRLRRSYERERPVSGKGYPLTPGERSPHLRASAPATPLSRR